MFVSFFVVVVSFVFYFICYFPAFVLFCLLFVMLFFYGIPIKPRKRDSRISFFCFFGGRELCVRDGKKTQ